MMTEYEIGSRFGKWTVLGPAEPAYDSKMKPLRRYMCRCDCGTERPVLRASLRHGVSTNCGCERYARFGQRARERIKTHGLSKTKAFRAWYCMMDRCYNKADAGYPNYGGRGIRVCDRWKDSFEAFLEDMGHPSSKDLSIDRIDVNGNYEPANCRWATRKQQARNTRRNRFVELDGETATVAEWCERLGIPLHAVKNRVNAGMSHAEAIRSASMALRAAGDSAPPVTG